MVRFTRKELKWATRPLEPPRGWCHLQSHRRTVTWLNLGFPSQFLNSLLSGSFLRITAYLIFSSFASCKDFRSPKSFYGGPGEWDKCGPRIVLRGRGFASLPDRLMKERAEGSPRNEERVSERSIEWLQQWICEWRLESPRKA